MIQIFVQDFGICRYGPTVAFRFILALTGFRTVQAANAAPHLQTRSGWQAQALVRRSIILL